MAESEVVDSPPSFVSESVISNSTNSTRVVKSNLENPKDAIEKGFQIIPKPTFEVGSYKLYHDTINQKIDFLYNAAKDSYTEGSYKSCLSYISKALYFDPDKVKYYVLGGDAFLGLKDFKSAILYYKRICILEPENEAYFTKLSHIYYLQGESFFEQESYLDALDCYTRASEIKPDFSEYHEKSLSCLASLNRHKECLNFINQRLNVDPTNTKLLIFRAKLHLLFCNSTLSYFDVKEVLSIDPSHEEAIEMYKELETSAANYKEKAETLDLSGKLKEAILKISQAISTNPSVTEYHVLRASMHRRNRDFNASVDDLLLAMDEVNHNAENSIFKDAQKQLLLTFNDFAVECFRKGFYQEAIVLLEKAIKGEKQDKALYSNRGDCFLKLEHIHFALLDYQQALELDPPDKAILLRLSIAYNELGIIEYQSRKYREAENYFSLAISHNPTVATYYVSRARSRYMCEKLMEAKVDIVSALYFDNANKEVLSMFSRLFSGKSTNDVLHGEFGSLVIEALESELKDLNIESKKKDSLTSSPPLPSIIARSSVDAQLEQCMEDREFLFSIIKGKKMVNDLYESVVQSRQDLSNKGPSLSAGKQKTPALGSGKGSRK